MSQRDCLLFLKKNKGKWFTALEIAKNLERGMGAVSTNMRGIRHYYKEIEVTVMERSMHKPKYFYRYP